MDFKNHLRQLQEDLLAQSRQPNIYGYVPHEKQLEFHKAQELERLFIGGNRSGKTTAGAAEMIYWLRGQHPHRKLPDDGYQMRCRSVSVDFTSGVNMIVKPAIQRWIPPSLLINGSWEDSYNSNDRLLTCANGAFLEFKSYDQDVIKMAGTSRHATWFDEEPPEEIFNECNLRRLDVKGSWWATLTPLPDYGGGISWLYDTIYVPGKQGYRPVKIIEVLTEENPTLDKALIDQMFENMSSEERAARQRGEFIQVGGLVFPMFSPEKHVANKMIWPVGHPKTRLFMSIDLGLNDPTAVLWHLIHDSGAVFTFKEHFASNMTIPQHAKEIHRIEREEIGRQPEVRVADPAMAQRSKQTGLSDRVYYMQHGIPLVGAKTNSIETGINKMTDYLHWDDEDKIIPRWYIHEDCENLIREMKRWKWKTRDSKKAQAKVNKGDKPVDKDNHCIDSAKYLFSFLPDLRNSKGLDTRALQARRDAAQIIHPSPLVHPEVGLRAKTLPPTNWTAVQEDGNIF